ncbi:proteolipid protein 2 [Tiliqua scincoides]|uniref:proteolipid protein 2 n=1 Tax=Tiliqua scincoides TaxID=71010 RepID=UPI003461EC40
MESSSNSKGCMGQFLTYVRTYKGAILVVEIVACIIILICFGASWARGYMGLSISMLVYTIVIFVIFMCSFHTQMTFIHWGWTDFLRTLIGAVAFLITSLIVLIQHRDGASVAAGVFGLLTAFLFGFDAYITFPKLRQPNPTTRTEPAEGI